MSFHPPTMSNPEIFAALKRQPRISVSDASKRTYAGIVYHSAAEAKHAAELDLKKRAGLIAGWRRQVPFQITVNNVKICRVVVDFGIDLANGTSFYEEIKGHETEEYKIKAKLLKAQYPELDYRVLKVRR